MMIQKNTFKVRHLAPYEVSGIVWHTHLVWTCERMSDGRYSCLHSCEMFCQGKKIKT